ncbi:KdsC family phosphatase [Paraclostridium bifermentans]|uniref:KdsC family phosphatase n=1 Tax=Paraclostridium bifermentans TaxID=1490 RepID=UPI00374EE5AC
MKNIKLIVLDVDGTLTDGSIQIDNLGNEIKSFNVKDGMGIAQAIKHGVGCAIITGRNSKIVEKRSKELGIEHVYQGIYNKKNQLELILNDLNISFQNVAYIGDDINDLEAMKLVEFSGCPNDSADEVKKSVDFISKYGGGKGAVREIIEYILKKQNLWGEIVNKYEGVAQ